MKIHDTRKQRAAKLLEQLTNGPSFSDPEIFGGEPMNAREASRQYRQWSQSWILAELKDLIPELRKR